MVRTPLEHTDHRGHQIMGEPLTSRHDFGRNHHIMLLVRTAGLALSRSVCFSPIVGFSEHVQAWMEKIRIFYIAM